MLILIFFLVLLIINVPVVFSIGLISVFFINQEGFDLVIVPQRLVGGSNFFPFLAIPFFLLAGKIMERGKLTHRLVEFATTVVGHIIGGLAHVNVITSMIMAGMTGSAVADTSAEGSVLIPAMSKAGYDKGFAAAITAASATIGPIIPPSIPMIVIASVANLSIGKLFIGGVIPGILMGIYLMLASYLVSRKRGYPHYKRASIKMIMAAFWKAIPVLFLPVIILGGILTGFFTPTEASVIAVVYAFILSLLYGDLKINDLPKIFVDSIAISSSVILLIAAASVAGWIMAIMRIPQAMVAYFTQTAHSSFMLLFKFNCLLLFLGAIMEPTPVIIILGPILVKAGLLMGIDPIHLGVIIVLNLMIGLITPPVGTGMFVACNIADISVADFSKEIFPFFIALIIVLFIVTYIPQTVTWLPSILMK